MPKHVYNKLVRDRIPEIIEAEGKIPVVRTLDEQEYIACLEAKLDEEVAEYHESGDISELADVLEVVYALANVREGGQAKLVQAYEAKHEDRGGFSEKIFLIETNSPS